MRKPGVIVILLLGVGMTSCANKPDLKPDDTESLAFLSGTWASQGEKEQFAEQWIKVHPRLMLGSAMVVHGEEQVTSEHLSIEQRDDGTYYVAHPAGQKRTEFRLTKLAGEKAVFENPDHDFPRRIEYQRLEPAPASEMSVVAEGVEDGKPRKLAFSLVFQADQTGVEPLVKQATVQASPEQIYQAFTTLEGVKTFFAPEAKVEPEPWGAYEMYFVPDAPAGKRGGEDCRFVELIPNERIAFTWNFPPSLPSIRDAHTLITVKLKPVVGAPGQTEVELTQSGFRAGPEWADGRAYFDRAWGIVLELLQKRFAEGPIDWSSLE